MRAATMAKRVLETLGSMRALRLRLVQDTDIVEDGRDGDDRKGPGGCGVLGDWGDTWLLDGIEGWT